MDTVTILRDLWRLRVFVAGMCVLALLGAAAVALKLPSLESRRYEVGVASAQILVDTPSSQVVNVAPKGADTTAGRADLLATLMINGGIKTTIAQLAGVQPNQIVGITGAATDPSTAAVSAPSGRDGYVLSTQVLSDSTGDQLPVIELATQAPSRDGAEKLASAAIAGLSQYLNSKAAKERIPDADRLQVDSLGAPQATTDARGPSNLMVALVFAALFGLGCAGILATRSVVRGWRAAARSEQVEQDAQHAEPVGGMQRSRDPEPVPDASYFDGVLAPDPPANRSALHGVADAASDSHVILRYGHGR